MSLLVCLLAGLLTNPRVDLRAGLLAASKPANAAAPFGARVASSALGPLRQARAEHHICPVPAFLRLLLIHRYESNQM